MQNELQTAYYELLNGALYYNSREVPIFDVISSEEDIYPCVGFGMSTGSDLSAKDTFGSESTKTLYIYDRFSTDNGSRRAVQDIAQQIKDIIRVRPVPFDIPGLNILTSYIDSESIATQTTDNWFYYIYELRFRHLIYKQ